MIEVGCTPRLGAKVKGGVLGGCGWGEVPGVGKGGGLLSLEKGTNCSLTS